MPKHDDAPETVQLEAGDSVNEMIVLAASMLDPNARARLVKILRPEQFLDEQHQHMWAGIQEIERRRLDYSHALLGQLVGNRVKSGYAAAMLQHFPEAPDAANLNHHAARLKWDHQRAHAMKGPFADLLTGFRDPSHPPERIRALAQNLADSLKGAGANWLSDPDYLVAQTMAGVRERIAGQATFPFGIPRLDFFESGAIDLKGRSIGGRARLIPGAKPGMLTVLTAFTGGGKALAVDTPVPTPSGWTTMGDLEPGDDVFDERGEVTSVLACTEAMVDHECFEVTFSDGSMVVADADHLWKTETASERSAAKRRTEGWQAKSNETRRLKTGAKTHRPNVSASLMRANVNKRVGVGGAVRTTRQIAESLVLVEKCKERTNHSVAVTAPLVMPDRALPIDPYVLGVWLGDGTTDAGIVTSADVEVMQSVANAGYTVASQQARYRWGVKGLQKLLREEGLLGNKHIPPLYLRASVAQRLALLQGLMDTDGSCTRDGKCNFDTMSEVLMREVWELILSLGIKVTPSQRVAKLHGREIGPAWRFVFCTTLPVFRLSRKLSRMRTPSRGTHRRRYIVAVEPVPSVPVRCIQVDSPTAMFLAGRSMVPTHNSTFAARMALGSFHLGRKVLYCAWEPGDVMTIELLAMMDLGWSRTNTMEAVGEDGLTVLSHEDLVVYEEKMHELSKGIVFMKNPFQKRSSGKPSNERNLDILQQHVADSGCHVWFADLWDRCLDEDRPEQVKRALHRTQSICEETQTHGVPLVQQKIKGDDIRSDHQPSVGNIFGTSEWAYVASALLAPHRPALFKRVDDVKLLVLILKQRWGGQPHAVEFDWDAEYGAVTGGITVPLEQAPADSELAEFIPPTPGGKRRRK